MSAPLIVSIGEPLLEFNQTRPGARRYLQGFGGDSSNMAIAAARSGAQVAYVTRVGDDPFGRMLLALWRAERVDTRGVTVDRRAHTGVYFVTHGTKGHAFHYLRAGSAASRMRRAHLPRTLIAGARYVHASGISLAISSSAADTVRAAFRLARRAGARISFDANLRLRLWPIARARRAILPVAAMADYFFLSLEDGRALSGRNAPEAILDWAQRLGAKSVVLKLGAGGAMVSDGAQRERIRGLKLRSVDATGAGDCFCGVALARLAAGDTLFEAARYANAAAALATTGFGAVAPLPRTSAVRALLGKATARGSLRRRKTAPR